MAKRAAVASAGFEFPLLVSITAVTNQTIVSLGYFLEKQSRSPVWIQSLELSLRVGPTGKGPVEDAREDQEEAHFGHGPTPLVPWHPEQELIPD